MKYILSFDRYLLRVKKVDANGDSLPFSIGLSGYGIFFDLDENIQFISNSPSVTIDAVQLGNTEIVVSLDDVTPFFSKSDIENSNLDLPPNFKGQNTWFRSYCNRRK